jgi:hypothetical protein
MSFIRHIVQIVAHGVIKSRVVQDFVPLFCYFVPPTAKLITLQRHTITAQSQYSADGSVTRLWAGQAKIRWFDSPQWQDIKSKDGIWNQQCF